MPGEEMPEKFLNRIKTHNFNAVILLLIFVGASIVYMHTSGTQGANPFDFRDDSLTVTAPGNSAPFAIRIDFGEVERVDIAGEESPFDRGVMIDGVQGRNLWYGEWENSELGSYDLYCRPQLDLYIIISTRGRTAAINLESNDATKSFAEALTAYMQERGYPVG